MINFFNAWVVLTLSLFYFGPVDWPGARDPTVALYVGFCLLTFNIGARFTFRKTDVVAKPFPFPRSRKLAYSVVIAYGLLAFVQISMLTGKSVLDPASYSLDFGQVYADYGVTQLQRSRGLVASALLLVKAGLFPIVLMIFVDRFKSDKLIIGAIVVPMIVSSLLRGTDKEFVDILILSFVAAFYHRLINWRMVLYAGLVPVALILFGLRRLSRFDGNLPSCLPETGVCFNYSSAVARYFGYNAEFVYVSTVHYLTNGYQGLSYALQQSWSANYGIGHLPPLKSAVCSVANAGCNLPDYQAKLPAAAGWDTSTKWTTAYTILANDLSFWLVPVYALLLGVLFAKSAALWRSARNVEAGCALILIAMFWVYSSANFQIAISLDWVVATIVFLYGGLIRRTRTRDGDQERSGRLPPAASGENLLVGAAGRRRRSGGVFFQGGARARSIPR